MTIQPDSGTDIHEAKHTNSGIHQKTGGIQPGLLEFKLPQIIDDGSDLTDVVEEVADTILQRIGHDLVVAFCDRLQHIEIQRVIETEHGSVKAFPGIPWVAFASGRHRATAHSSNEDHQQHAHQDATCHYHRSGFPIRNTSARFYPLMAFLTKDWLAILASAIGIFSQSSNPH